MEVLGRLKLPAVPVDPVDVARKADLGAHLGASPPSGAHVGMLWAKPDTDEAELFVWTGTKWLPFLGATPPTGLTWGDPGLTWGGGERWG